MFHEDQKVHINNISEIAKNSNLIKKQEWEHQIVKIFKKKNIVHTKTFFSLLTGFFLVSTLGIRESIRISVLP